MQEKRDLAVPSIPGETYRARALRHLVLCSGLIVAALVVNNFIFNPANIGRQDCGHLEQREPLCPQLDALDPSNPIWRTVGELISTDAFKERAVDWLAGAVQIPTEIYDDVTEIDDHRWDSFRRFHEYLLEAFPLVHSSLKLTKVNSYGLLYEWTGADLSLKPVLLAAHQDVVPVEPQTVADWTYPPFSGHFDGTRIWGRGSSDDKSGLIGLLSAIESMLELGFSPERTLVLSFGCDEEASGHFGARELGKAMLDIYGRNSFAFIVDEGGGFSEEYGTTFATPGVAEKGYLDLRIDVASLGGHSSVPPSHTTIGMLSRILVELEENPFPVEMSTESVLYGTLKCYASHGKTMPLDLRKAIVDSTRSKKALKHLGDILFTDPTNVALVGSTQAIDIVQGGVKSNALPEQAYAVVNHRISTLSSLAEVIEHDTKTIKGVAERFNLTFISFGETISDPGVPGAFGSLVLSDAYNSSLPPLRRRRHQGHTRDPMSSFREQFKRHTTLIEG
ncbi:hypothetical protein D9757_004794 [Collybiopsis confluens]|uniref:Peptidase M20 dimerisation domain-containing protein n=1 Tax=Collybiopsis confluens TaxID=2823264 RepID=A0A8H5MC80_9AGAR|nr:hypothetical protein D9757_004794 [Collybiopsis confluens]